MELDEKFLDGVIKRLGDSQSSIIPILQAIQTHYSYVPLKAIEYVSRKTKLPEAQIYGVATFYAQFKFQPQGKYNIKVCHGTACHVSGARAISETLEDILSLSHGGGTTEDRMFSVEKVACLGCCSLAPVMMVKDKVFGKLNRKKIEKIIEHYRQYGDDAKDEFEFEGLSFEKAGRIRRISIGMGSCGIAAGASTIEGYLKGIKERFKLKFDIRSVGCMGICHAEPMMEIIDEDDVKTLYGNLDLLSVKRIVIEHIGNGTIVEDKQLVLKDSKFLKGQRHIVLSNCGRIDPENIDEYERAGGYSALKKAIFEISPDAVIDEVLKSGLRGRGGAGFLTGLKWGFVRKAKGDKKYLICNADEGDPGAFMDRSVLESDPHKVLEGMIIASYAIGASEGYIYCRAEYPLALKSIAIAIEDAKAKGYLGDKILGSSHSFNIKVKEGAGAFVCGEETALIASIEGARGMPKIRPPFPAQKGLFSRPTNINNVETFGNVPWIIQNGSKAFSSMGTEKSKGTKVFALAGDIKNGGLVEVPMGITLREIVQDIGGGTSSGRSVKAVQLGGPSGGCIPHSLMDTVVDYDALVKTGAIMGSGGLVVMDDSNCMVDIAKFFLNFTQNESCGKCTFCRIGTRRMLEILDRITEGRGRLEDLDLIEELAHGIKSSSLCGLGQTAPNPVLTTLKYFKDEYVAHIEDKKCPAHKCRALIRYEINEKCTGCTLCAKNCPEKCISGEVKKIHVIDQTRCTKCGICKDNCKFGAVEVK